MFLLTKKISQFLFIVVEDILVLYPPIQDKKKITHFFLQFTASDYPFGIFWPLYCLSFNLQLLITPLVSFDHCIVCPSIYSFWLPLWYLLTIILSVLQFTASDYPFGIFKLFLFQINKGLLYALYLVCATVVAFSTLQHLWSFECGNWHVIQ
jgi:hypothetical protein